MKMTTTTAYESIGRLSVRLQSPLSVIRAACDVLGVKPSLELNDTVYYAAEDCELIARYLEDSRVRKDAQ